MRLESIYIAITVEGNKGRLSGKYNSYGLKNDAAAFIREGGKLTGLEEFHPYYLMFKDKWLITDSESFESNDGKAWLKLETKGLF